MDSASRESVNLSDDKKSITLKLEPHMKVKL